MQTHMGALHGEPVPDNLGDILSRLAGETKNKVHSIPFQVIQGGEMLPQSRPKHPYGATELRAEKGGAIDRALRHTRADGGVSLPVIKPAAMSLTGAPGSVKTEPYAGPLHSTVPGRTDKIKLNVKPGSFVIPADVVSIIGEGNTLTGTAMLKAAFDPNFLTGGMKVKGTKGKMGMHPPPVPSQLPTQAPGVSKPAMAEGGEAKGNVPIIVAGGEHILEPESLIAKFGSLPHAHKTLDEFVEQVRDQEYKRLATAPGTKK